MATGPTQNYAEAEATTWRPRPVLATLVRLSASAGPLLLALAVGAGAARWLPATRTGLPWPLWLLLVVVVSSGVLVVCSRWLRRLVPLSALLRLSLVLPDRVPSRFEVARRTWSPSALEGAAEIPDTDRDSAEWLLGLLGTLAAHDARTRAHGERVQAYAALIGHELGLARDDVDRLSWAALLHDVGKVHVPTDIINKNGRPTEEEWASLQQHPCHGGRLVRPLRGWLGPWLDGVEQHHERWDGHGYPHGLSGDQVSLAARVIAVADTYDVITSARAYKKPLSAEAARAEITRCAGAQFDPEVVRAFLSIGIGRLRLIAGPATLVAALPGVGAVPAQTLSTASALAQTVGGQVLSVLLTAGVGVVAGATATHAATQAWATIPADAAVTTGTTSAAAAADPAAVPADPADPADPVGTTAPSPSPPAALPTTSPPTASPTSGTAEPSAADAASRLRPAPPASRAGETSTASTATPRGDDAPGTATRGAAVPTRADDPRQDPIRVSPPTRTKTPGPTATPTTPATPTASTTTPPPPATGVPTAPSTSAPGPGPTADPAPSTTSTAPPPTAAPPPAPTAAPGGTATSTSPPTAAPTATPAPTAVPLPTPTRTPTPPPTAICIGIVIHLCFP